MVIQSTPIDQRPIYSSIKAKSNIAQRVQILCKLPSTE